MTRIDAHGMISRKRFPDTGGWGFAQFNYDAASDTFTPDGSDPNCGYACHTIVAAKGDTFPARTGTRCAFGPGRKRTWPSPKIRCPSAKPHPRHTRLTDDHRQRGTRR